MALSLAPVCLLVLALVSVDVLGGLGLQAQANPVSAVYYDAQLDAWEQQQNLATRLDYADSPALSAPDNLATSTNATAPIAIAALPSWLQRLPLPFLTPKGAKPYRGGRIKRKGTYRKAPPSTYLPGRAGHESP
jgi:hypothetical protein